MSAPCPDCGLHDEGTLTCRERLNSLLFIEAEVPGAARGLPHFYAVACFNVQHQRTMKLTDAAVQQAVTSLDDALAGRVTIQDLLRRGRHLSRAGTLTAVPGTGTLFAPERWSMRITDALGATPATYVDIVTAWARQVVADAVD